MSSLTVKIAVPSRMSGFEPPVTSACAGDPSTITEVIMITRNLIFIASIATLLSACAEQQSSQQVQVSPQEFKKYNCKQIAKESDCDAELDSTRK